MGVGALLRMMGGAVERERVSTALGAVLPRDDVGFLPEGISVRHLDRLLDGLLLGTSSRVEWAKLLRRTYAVDVLTCPRCSGRMRLMAAITDKATARKMLSHLGLCAERRGSPWSTGVASSTGSCTRRPRASSGRPCCAVRTASMRRGVRMAAPAPGAGVTGGGGCGRVVSQCSPHEGRAAGRRRGGAGTWPAREG